MNRGVEIDSDVADGPHSVILPQVTNGVAVRMAVLYLLAGGSPDWSQQGGGERHERPMLLTRRPGHRSVAQRRTTSPTCCSQDGRIAAVGRNIGAPEGAEVLDVQAAGWWRRASIDVHVHLREPGQEDLETIATGAARGGGGRVHRHLRHAEHRPGVRQPGRGRVS